MCCLDLKPRLNTRSENACCLDVSWRKMPRSDSSGGGRAHIGQVAIVEKQRLDQPGLCREQDHQAVEAWQAKLGIVEETGAHLDREAIETRDVGGLHVHFAV